MCSKLPHTIFPHGQNYKFCLLMCLGGEDYIELRKSITLQIGIDHRCVAIVALEDNIPEKNETFQLTTEELGISTTITLINDDCKYAQLCG